MENLIIVLILLPFALTIYVLFFKQIKIVHSNWNSLTDDFKYSTVDFYKLFKEEMKTTKVKGILYQDVNLSEGVVGISRKRKYLRLEWQKYTFDVCAAPFGRGMFFSWWVIYKMPFLYTLFYMIPLIGLGIARILFPFTYYKYDSATMFMKYAHAVTLSVIDSITTEQGVRILTEDERKPAIRSFDDVMKR